MAKKEGYSREGLFDTVYHYDSAGHKIGESRPGFFGGYNNYDAKGHKVGESRPGFFGGYTNYDTQGHKTGSVSPGFFGSQVHYDAKGHRIGTSDPTFLGEQSHSGNFGGNAGLINNAGAAAGVRRDDRTIRTVIGITTAASAAREAQSEWFDEDDEDGSDWTHSSGSIGYAPAPSPDATAQKEPDRNVSRTVHYYIVRSSSGETSNYRTDDVFEIGDIITEPETGEDVEVLASVDCLEEALPPR